MIRYALEQFGLPLVEQRCERPDPTGHEVVVRVGSCGVCHSDVHLADGYFDLGNGNRVPLTASVAPPRTLGHEIAGTVAAVGDAVSGVAVGDRRVVYPWIGCGRCAACVAGDEHLCIAARALGINVDGGFADHVLVPHARYLFDYGSMSEEQACTYACSGLTAFGALRKVRHIGAQPWLVIGAGGVGLSAIRMAAALGFAPPVVAETDAAKHGLAKAAGAGEVIDPNGEGVARATMKATGGFAAVVDFVGAGTSFAFGFGLLRKGGIHVTVGLMGGATAISPALIALKAATIVGSYVGSPAEFAELMTLAKTADFPPLPVVEHPLAAADAALGALRAGQVRGRAVLKP